MTDPFRIFADASPSKQQMLATVWKKLYTTLAKLDRPKVARTVTCVTCVPAGRVGPQALAVARPTPGGPPVCARCLARMRQTAPGSWYAALVTRPEGFPLQREATS